MNDKSLLIEQIFLSILNGAIEPVMRPKKLFFLNISWIGFKYNRH